MRKRSEMIRKLHDEGLTYEKIGEIFGISKQAAQQASRTGLKDYFHENTIQKVKYAGLRKWMLKNRMSLSKMEQATGMSRLYKTLTGACEPRKKTIDAILSVTGLTYEECFKEDPQ